MILFFFYILFIIIVIISCFTIKEDFDVPIPVIYINLDNRPDRKHYMEKQLKNYGLNNFYRISATYTPKNGHKGCADSHYRALRMAKEKGWDKVLIMEDDFKFDITPEEFSKKKIPNSNWNVLLLTAAYETSKPINDEIHQLLGGAQTASAYIVKKHYIPKLEKLFKECYDNMPMDKTSSKGYEHWAIDQKWKPLQNENWLVYSPKLGNQNNQLISSIQATTNYDS